MSASKLGAKKLRSVEALVGEPLHHAFAWPSGVVEAVTPDDRHFKVNRRTAEVAELDPATVCHWNTCPDSRNEHRARRVLRFLGRQR